MIAIVIKVIVVVLITIIIIIITIMIVIIARGLPQMARFLCAISGPQLAIRFVRPLGRGILNLDLGLSPRLRGARKRWASVFARLNVLLRGGI